MVGQLVELSAFGRNLKCCHHLKGHVGLIVDFCGVNYWIEWVGMKPEEAYPERWMGGATGSSIALTNGTWNRRDFKLVK